MRRRLAIIMSWIGHPLVFVTVSVGIIVLTQLSHRAAWSILLVMFLSVIAPVGILLFLGVRSGRWRDADVSVREERKRFYPFAIPLSVLGTVATWFIGAPSYILRGGIVTLVVLFIAAITNLWFKISLHALFASYCAAVLFQVNTLCGAVATAAAALVFWSRLYLRRHSLAEMIAGILLGTGAGFIAGWI